MLELGNEKHVVVLGEIWMEKGMVMLAVAVVVVNHVSFGTMPVEIDEINALIDAGKKVSPAVVQEVKVQNGRLSEVNNLRIW